MKVACFSVAALDFFPQLNDHYAGGNSLNQAVRFRQMGHPSAFVGALGTDEAGDPITELLRAAAVDASHLRRVAGFTAHNQIINDAAGERYGIDGAWEGGVYENFQMDEADWAYLSDFYVWATHANSPVHLDALERKTPAQFMAVEFLHLRDDNLLRKSLAVIDIAYFGGTEDMADDLAQIARDQRGLIVLTLGAGGSMAFAGEQIYTQPALAIERVVDPTGCGDAFQAGFTASYDHANDIDAALLAGAELGR